jgi:hypothetical protein
MELGRVLDVPPEQITAALRLDPAAQIEGPPRGD